MSEVEKIEQQHHELVSHLNRLNDAVKSYQPRKDIYRIIDDVISYTGFHFAIEERIMVQAGFPEIDAHKDHHGQLIRKAHRLREKLDYVGEDMFSEWFHHWYFTSMIAHIEYADKPIEEYIIQSGKKK